MDNKSKAEMLHLEREKMRLIISNSSGKDLVNPERYFKRYDLVLILLNQALNSQE
jgi:hypothetical protein